MLVSYPTSCGKQRRPGAAGRFRRRQFGIGLIFMSRGGGNASADNSLVLGWYLCPGAAGTLPPTTVWYCVAIYVRGRWERFHSSCGSILANLVLTGLVFMCDKCSHILCAVIYFVQSI